MSSLVYEVKRLSQALCWPLGLIGCLPSLSQVLEALETCCLRSCIFYKLGQDSDIQCVHCRLYHIYTADILAFLCVQVCTNEPSGLCGLLTALQQPSAAKIHVGVDDFVWCLPVLFSWYPYFKWLHQLIFLQDSILV